MTQILRPLIDVVQTATGVAIAGASVTITTYPDNAVVQAYQDIQGATPVVSPGNVVYTNTLGMYEAYVPDGWYTLAVSSGLASYSENLYVGTVDQCLVVPLNGSAYTIPVGVEWVLFTGSTLSTQTITFPTGPVNGQELSLRFVLSIMALTMSGNGNSIYSGDALTTIASNTSVTYKFFNGPWYLK